MLDPTTLLPLVNLAGKLIGKINNFLQKAKYVDTFLTGLSNEIICFQNVLRTLETKYTESGIGKKAIGDETLHELENQQWAAVESIVRFCTTTLGELEVLMEEIMQKGVLLSNIRKVTLQGRVQQRERIIEIRRQEIASYRQVLETALISIAVYTPS
jgi:hypothetical protein